jgi:hypothetical protein
MSIGERSSSKGSANQFYCKEKCSPDAQLAKEISRVAQLNCELVTARNAPDFLSRALNIICERVEFVENYLRFQEGSRQVIYSASTSSSGQKLWHVTQQFRDMVEKISTEFVRAVVASVYKDAFVDSSPSVDYLLHRMKRSTYEEIYVVCCNLISKVAYLKDFLGADGSMHALSSNVFAAEDAEVLLRINEYKASMGCQHEEDLARRIFENLFSMQSRSSEPFHESIRIFHQMAKYPAPHDKLLMLEKLEESVWLECSRLVQERVEAAEVTPDLFNSALVYIIVASAEW